MTSRSLLNALTDLSDALADLIERGPRLNFFVGDDTDNVIITTRGIDFVFAEGGNDLVRLGSGNDVANGGDGDDEILGGRGDDLVSGDAGNDSLSGNLGNDELVGGAGNDTLDGGRGNDRLEGGSAADILTGGFGRDVFVYAGDPFDGVDVSAAGRQVVGNEDTITDFAFHRDSYAFNAADFGVDALVFAAADGNDATAAAALDGANAIVLLNADNDANAATPFNAGAAANQIAGLIDTDGAGFFVYFNTDLQLNRLVYSTNLNDATADLKILSRQTDLTGQDAIDALAEFSAANFTLFEDAILS